MGLFLEFAISVVIPILWGLMAPWLEHPPARRTGILPVWTRFSTSFMAFVMLCAPIFLAAHGALAEDSCAGGAADHALVEVCPVCEICDSIPAAVDVSDPLPGVFSPVSGRQVFPISVWASKSIAADPAAPRAPPLVV